MFVAPAVRINEGVRSGFVGLRRLGLNVIFLSPREVACELRREIAESVMMIIHNGVFLIISCWNSVNTRFFCTCYWWKQLVFAEVCIKMRDFIVIRIGIEDYFVNEVYSNSYAIKEW